MNKERLPLPKLVEDVVAAKRLRLTAEELFASYGEKESVRGGIFPKSFSVIFGEGEETVRVTLTAIGDPERGEPIKGFLKRAPIFIRVEDEAIELFPRDRLKGKGRLFSGSERFTLEMVKNYEELLQAVRERLEEERV